MTIHFLASLLSGDPASVRTLQRELRGRSLDYDKVIEYAQRLSDEAREGDSDAVEIFESDLGASELIGKVITNDIIMRVNDDGVTGRAIDTENDDHYEDDDDDAIDVEEDDDGDSQE